MPARGADFHFAMKRDNATMGTALQDDVAAALTHVGESQPHERTDDLGTGKTGQLRHDRPLQRWSEGRTLA